MLRETSDKSTTKTLHTKAFVVPPKKKKGQNRVAYVENGSHPGPTFSFQFKLLLLGPNIMIVLCKQLCHGLQVKTKWTQ